MLGAPSQRETVPRTSSTWLPNCLRLCRFPLGVRGLGSCDDVGLGLWTADDMAGLDVAAPSEQPRLNGGGDYERRNCSSSS